MMLLFVLFAVAAQAASQASPVPQACPPGATPISNSRIAQLLGPGSIGPVQISDILSFGYAFQVVIFPTFFCRTSSMVFL
jgi:hypothetical protein